MFDDNDLLPVAAFIISALVVLFIAWYFDLGVWA